MPMMKQAETPMPHCNKSNVALMQMTVAGKETAPTHPIVSL